MKKFCAIIIIATLACNAGGFLLLFTIEQWGIHTAMENAVKEAGEYSTLKKITLSNAAFEQAQTRAGEIRLHGAMYDVVTIIEERDSITLYCINDTNEEQLFAELAKFFSPEKDKPPDRQQTLPQQFVKFLTLTFVQPEPLFTATMHVHRIHPHHLTLFFPQIFPRYSPHPPKN